MIFPFRGVCAKYAIPVDLTFAAMLKLLAGFARTLIVSTDLDFHSSNRYTRCKNARQYKSAFSRLKTILLRFPYLSKKILSSFINSRFHDSSIHGFFPDPQPGHGDGEFETARTGAAGI